MNIDIDTSNCNYDNFYEIEELANSSIKLKFEIATILTSQSRKQLFDSLIASIHIEISKFKWIIIGSVLIDMLWYLNAVERQETDKVGDLDNISKPIIDSLLGPNGILVDDSQIGGLYTYWQSRNHLSADNILYIEIKFNNDYVLFKKDLLFIQYKNAICMPVNCDFTDTKSILAAKTLVNARIRQRSFAKRVKVSGANADRYLVASEYDFHRTRLNTFPGSQILTLSALNSFHS